MRIVIAACVLALLASPAGAADVDWRLYGGASVSGQSWCFYDANTVAHLSGGLIRFWTKCVLQKDLGVKLTDAQVQDAAEKLVQGYVPPIIVIGRVDFAKIEEIVSLEEIADSGTIESQSKMFIEMNCTERMYRRLSTTLRIDGQNHFLHKPSEWDYVPPESNPANLLKMLCSPIK